MREYKTTFSSPLGEILIKSSKNAITSLSFTQAETKKAETKKAETKQTETCRVLEKAKVWLEGYFAGKNSKIDFPLEPNGTPFQKMVWQCLLDINYGEVSTYGMVAKKVAQKLGKQKMSARAVGRAVGSNPISIIIPCHRVLGANGALTGYAWGLERKIKLLELEKTNKELP